MDLVRDVLDKLVVDRNGREIGRADSIVLELAPDRRPVVSRLELGSDVLFSRVSPTLGRWMAGLRLALGAAPRRSVPFDGVLDIERHIKVDLAAGGGE